MTPRRRPELRVLCTSTGGAGHIHALAPVARALRDAGHDVEWAVAEDGGPAVAALGFAWSRAGMTTSDRRAAVADDLRAIMQIRAPDRRGPLYATLFARTAAPAMYEDLVPIVERVRPDIVIREVGELAGAAVALAGDLPIVTVAFSGVLPEAARGRVLAELVPLWHRAGLADPSWSDLYGALYLHPFPPSFGQRPESPSTRPLRPVGAAPSEHAPNWVRQLGQRRPCVYVTAGTESPATTFPWRAVLTAVRALDVGALVTIGPHVADADLGTIPPHVRVERYVPQADVLGRVAVVVSHGGAGTVLGAASHGRVQVVVPLFADQWENGTAVATAGCGVLVGTDERTAEQFEQHLRAALDGPSHRDAAARVADEIAAMPTANDLVSDIVALARA